MGAFVEPCLESCVISHGVACGHEPDEAENNQARNRYGSDHAFRWGNDEPKGARQFKKHRRADHPGGASLVRLVVGRELIQSDLCFQGVMDDLDEPDEPGHVDGGQGVKK